VEYVKDAPPTLDEGASDYSAIFFNGTRLMDVEQHGCSSAALRVWKHLLPSWLTVKGTRQRRCWL